MSNANKIPAIYIKLQGEDSYWNDFYRNEEYIIPISELMFPLEYINTQSKLDYNERDDVDGLDIFMKLVEGRKKLHEQGLGKGFYNSQYDIVWIGIIPMFDING